MVKELNKRPDHRHLREDVELLKGSLELLRDKEELLSSEVDALKSEVSHFKACELDLECEMLETHVLSAALEFSLNNCAIKEKAHARETRNVECQLQPMKFLLIIMDSRC